MTSRTPPFGQGFEEAYRPGATAEALDSGLACLLMMTKFHGIAADPHRLRHEFGEAPMTCTVLSLAARKLGLATRIVRQPLDRLDKAPLPCIARDREGGFFILAKIDHGQPPAAASGRGAFPAGVRCLIQRPGEPPRVLSGEIFLSQWSGELLLLTSKASLAGEMARFDFTWFIPAVIKYRHLLGEVLIASLTLQLLALVTPLFFQVVMDKVLVNHAMQTLNVIAAGLLGATIFEALLTGVRTYVLAHTSSKIDVELGSRLFRHLLDLPLTYFQSRRVGDSVARVRELEHIRAFLTGNALTLILDLAFSVVFLAVMLWYSVQLTLIVLASIPVYVGLSLLFTPLLRSRLSEKFNRGAENQAFLVETIHGIDTVKAMAVEPRWQDRWDRQLAGYVSAGLAATNISTVAGGGITLVSKLVTVAILWVGAAQVIDSQLTVGGLIAFNMLATQVAAPILRLAQLWNDFQQIGISMSRLGDILNTRTEISNGKAQLPRLAGAIAFKGVSFRYRPDAADVLHDVDLTIAPGEVIGIVGRSGSGKSTLGKLIQRFYVPDRGRVLVDGQDVGLVEPAALRQQIGVVPQENLLFGRSIRDNIALARPATPLEDVIRAAQLAGAHEFITDLPNGYDTQVGENGTGLSGGQRQRVAIARALLTDPRILILDEATSALDYESERVISDNMCRICQGRTVIIIAHRLSAVRHAHRMIVMDQGTVAEQGTHEQLVEQHGGIYSRLWQLQQDGLHIHEPPPEPNGTRPNSEAFAQPSGTCT